MLKKLRLKFVCILMAVVTVMLCVIFGLVIQFTRQNMEQESMEKLQRAASEPGFFGSVYGSGELLPYFVISRDMLGNLRISGTVYFEGYGEEKLRQIYDSANQAPTQSGEMEEYDLLFLKDGGRIVFLDISSQRLAMKSLTRVCVTVGIVSFILLLGASALLAGWAVKPVEKAWEQQRRFVADASHELKTPLTVIMTNAELLQEEADSQPARNILTMSRHMRFLVEGMLELARVDNGAVRKNAEMLDLSAMTEEAMLPFEPLFFEKGLTLNGEVEPGIQVKGNESYLRQVLDILLDNAMKYSAPAGKIFVVLKRKGNQASLAVANPGAIPEEDLENLFKRFYRVDKARSRDGSYGLGLAIAQSIVTEHGGKIWAENDDGWVVFRVQLPVS